MSAPTSRRHTDTPWSPSCHRWTVRRTPSTPRVSPRPPTRPGSATSNTSSPSRVRSPVTPMSPTRPWRWFLLPFPKRPATTWTCWYSCFERLVPDDTAASAGRSVSPAPWDRGPDIETQEDQYPGAEKTSYDAAPQRRPAARRRTTDGGSAICRRDRLVVVTPAEPPQITP